MLLVVEDDLATRRAIDRLLGDRPRTHAPSAKEARAAITRHDGLTGCLLDVGLPEGPRAGLALLGWIRERHLELPCALVTGSCEPDVVNTAARLRARVLIKPATLELQAWVIEQVDAPTPAQLVDAVAQRARVQYRLTERETEVVAWFLHGGDVASFLTSSGMSRSTFKSHRASVLAKTGDDSLERLGAALLQEALARRGHSFR